MSQPIRVRVSAPPVINTVIKKYQIPFISLDDLIDVDSGTVQDGYTIVYDANTQRWNVGPFGSTGDIDGGAY